MGWLDQFFHGYETILNAGALLLARAKINLVAPLVATDDPTNKWTSIAISPASSTAAGLLSAADYAKIQAVAPGSYLPRATPVSEPAAPALAPGITFLAFAAESGSSCVTSAALIAGDSLTADDTDYTQVDLHDRNLAAGTNSASLWTGTTQTTGQPEGSGDWVAGKIAFAATLNYVLPAGHALIAVWSSGGTGVSMPGGAWRVT